MICFENLTIATEVLLVLFLLSVCVIAIVSHKYLKVKYDRDILKLDSEQDSLELQNRKYLLKVKGDCIVKLRERIDDLGDTDDAKDSILVALFSQLDKATLQQMLADLEAPPHGNKKAEHEVCELLRKAIVNS